MFVRFYSFSFSVSVQRSGKYAIIRYTLFSGFVLIQLRKGQVDMAEWWQQRVDVLKGIGKKKQEAFLRLNVESVGDLLNYLPRLDAYVDLSELCTIKDLPFDGSRRIFTGEVVRYREGRARTGIRYGVLTVRDDTGFAELYFFGGQRFTAKKFKNGSLVLITGSAKPGMNAKSVSNAFLQPLDKKTLKDTLGILPVYPLTESLTQKNVRDAMRQAIKMAEKEGCEETVPLELVKAHKLMDRLDAVKNIHFPQSIKKLKEAKRRMIYEELFLLQCGLLLNREENYDGRQAVKNAPDGKKVKILLKSLPFKLTPGQKQAWREISSDMEDNKGMNRLLQGDVGSGKTVLAALALAKAAENGYQACLMAPTEILAVQHYETLREWFSKTGLNLRLLTGSTPISERRLILQEIQEGEADIIIGTHALIQDTVNFAALSLVVTDEQHRFGVGQRTALTDKAKVSPDVLVMTATPIPRTLALTVYGDVDVSVMKGKPPGRRELTTLCYTGDMRDQVYEGLRRQVKAGHQAYVVCASIEETSNMEGVRSVNEVYEDLTARFPEISCGLLHGKMPAAEKERVMQKFLLGEISVLVATTVIEVGVNVPNATLMIVENADRFGLAQLHQLRGRVGRGESKSFCALLTDNTGADNLARLSILHDSNDGFALAEKDLELRGAGQLFGLKQHGLPDLRIADILRDTSVLLQCRSDAKKTLEDKNGREDILKAVEKQFDNRFAGILNS